MPTSIGLDLALVILSKTKWPDIIAQRTFAVTQGSGLPFFSFADITAQVKSTGSGVYNLSELDLRDVIDYYCGNATNFGVGIVYKNANLPLNQLTVYDGLHNMSDEINITLNSLNVIDNKDARKILLLGGWPLYKRQWNPAYQWKSNQQSTLNP
jgi:hypothetical protein